MKILEVKLEMEKRIEIAAIGSNDTILLYNAVGMKTIIIPNSADINLIDQKIFELANSGIRIIYISEDLYIKIPEVIEKYKMQVFPIIIPIPLKEKSDGIGLNKIKENVEKAIGFNIF